MAQTTLRRLLDPRPFEGPASSTITTKLAFRPRPDQDCKPSKPMRDSEGGHAQGPTRRPRRRLREFRRVHRTKGRAFETMPIPLLGGLLPFKPREAAKDALAGLTLASMNIPQVLGYTRIAGTPVVTGLYTVLLPLVGFALFGSSRHLVVAADSATAAIFSSALSRMAPIAQREIHGAGRHADPADRRASADRAHLQARLPRRLPVAHGAGRVSDRRRRPGRRGDARRHARRRRALASARSAQLWEVATGLSGLSPLSLALSAFVVAAILLGHRFAPQFPVPLVVVVGMIVASAGFDLRRTRRRGDRPGARRPALRFRWPDVSWRETLDLLPVAASCFVMIIAQSAATSRVYAIKHHERVDENADILGLAAANAGAALTGAFVVNGSPTQTAMADNAGARSQVAQLVFAGVVVVVLLALTGFLQYLPRCVLAAIVFTIAIGMIDVKGLSRHPQAKAGESFRLALGVAAAVPGVGVEAGHSAGDRALADPPCAPQLSSAHDDLRESAEGRWVATPALPGAQTEPGLIIYRFGADLFYANADRFVDEARALIERAPTPVRWFIVDASAVTDIDYSAAKTLRDLFSELKKQNVNVAFGRCDPGLRADLERHGLAEIIGEDRILASLHSALALADGGKEKLRPIAG